MPDHRPRRQLRKRGGRAQCRGIGTLADAVHINPQSTKKTAPPDRRGRANETTRVSALRLTALTTLLAAVPAALAALLLLARLLAAATLLLAALTRTRILLLLARVLLVRVLLVRITHLILLAG